MKTPLAVLLLSVHVAVSPSTAGGIYWSNRGSGLLERSLYDGTGRSTVLDNAGSNVRGIALDLLHNKIYYADNGLDILYQLNLDGTDRIIIFQTGPSSFPADLKLDISSGQIYFCDQSKAQIRRVNFDGSSPATLITDATYQPYYLDLDPVKGKIYWGDFDGTSANTGNVFRMNRDGSGRETIVTGNLETRAVCVDTAGQMLYWVNRNAAKIMRCPLGALPVNANDATKVQTLYAGLDTPHGMVLDVPAGKVYWVDTGTNPGVGLGSQAISRGDMDGSGPHEILVNPVSEPWDIDIDPRPASYGEWVARFFVKNAGAISNPSADPDGDLLPNLVECALGLNPSHPDFLAIPEFVLLKENGQTFPAIRFPHRPGVAGLTLLPQHSTDAGSWWDETSPTDGIPRLLPVSATPVPGGEVEIITVRSIFSFQQSPTQYFRLKAILTN
jgi:hypothetical protein